MKLQWQSRRQSVQRRVEKVTTTWLKKKRLKNRHRQTLSRAMRTQTQRQQQQT